MEINIKEVVVQIINFLLLFFLLRIFAWKRLLGFLDGRKAKIAAEFKQIEDTKVELAKLKSEYEVKLNSADKQAREKIEEALDQGKKAVVEIKKSAYLESQKIMDTAREDIKYELSKAKEELKVRMVDLTMQATEALIQDKLSEEQDSKLVKDFLDKLSGME